MFLKVTICIAAFFMIGSVLVFLYVYKNFIQKNTNEMVNSVGGNGNAGAVENDGANNYLGYEEELDAKSFVEVDEFFDYAFSIAPLRYRAIIECSSISYGLKTPTEREMIEYGFQSMLNNLEFPIVLYVQTRLVDNSKIIRKMEDDIARTVINTPEMKEYSYRYLEEMRNLSSTIGFPKCKKKYIIIPYEIETDMSALSYEEREEFCLEELYTRASIICNSLHSIGISAKVLNKEDTAKVIYASFNRNGFLLVEEIMRGELNRLVIQGKNYAEEFTPMGILEAILYQTNERINKELIDISDNREELELFKSVVEAIKIIKNRVDLGNVSLEEKELNEAKREEKE